ncbi:uncharacterized protein F4822DRAFT_442462 [Hypoxylon trugodes]|uniref:uncharacterized protein n=1 Tax=Hypoxylon trugodes TaxID=326681 RepID=UPI00218E8D31|nr:uncharacterized protein F4822DRAFT_442462 [Hypoxylon trugodes]KAI1391500.1 hypothetical protein F4822DRAFT_442462 [Hypoxylon trugodes]
MHANIPPATLLLLLATVGLAVPNLLASSGGRSHYATRSAQCPDRNASEYYFACCYDKEIVFCNDQHRSTDDQKACIQKYEDDCGEQFNCTVEGPF